MEFRNRTPFPALAFEGLDPDQTPFRVVVLRQTLSFASGAARYSDQQAPLCTSDQFWGEPNASSVRQESDLCHFKPRCDVIVNATAHPPPGRRAGHFKVTLAVHGPVAPVAPPPRQRGHNLLQDADPNALQDWRNACEAARHADTVGRPLLHKELTVWGEREFRQRWWPARLAGALLRCLTLGLWSWCPWRLTSAKALQPLPLRHEYAFGGQCRIDIGSEVARRVRSRDQLTAQQVAAHPGADGDTGARPLAHCAWDANPVGAGFVRDWYLRAYRRTTIPAPRIEYAHGAITARSFWRAARNQAAPSSLHDPAGFGIRAKAHPARRALVGTVDQAFCDGPDWLPRGFDFAIWNCAPADQQLDFLTGDETIELTNLCTPQASGAEVDPAGDVRLRLALPGNECFVLLRHDSGKLATVPMQLDTVLVESDALTMTLVWRLRLEKWPDLRVCEARMRPLAERRQLEELKRVMGKRTEGAPA